jgi:hypothetical protein
MPYNVIVDHPNLGEQSLYIHGLGTFENNSTTEVSDEQIDRFRAAHSVVNLSDPHPETGLRKHMPAMGRHPVDLDIYGVRVEPVGEEPKSTGEEVS